MPTVNESVIAVRPVKKKEPRPPPVTVLGHDNLFQTNRELKTALKEDFKVSIPGKASDITRPQRRIIDS